MSLAIAHFAIGGTCTALVAFYLLPPTRYARTLVLLGGVWGMVPDIHWVIPIYAPELKALHTSVFTNVFWFHQTLDVVDPTDSYMLAALALGAFIITVGLGDHWTYRTDERSPETAESGRFSTARSLESLTRGVGVLAFSSGVGLVVAGSLHPGVGELRGLFFGVGAALVGVGSIAAGGRLAVAPWITARLPVTVTRGLVVLSSLALAIGGGTLVGSPLRYGVTANSVVVGGVGGLLLVLAVLSARVRLHI